MNGVFALMLLSIPYVIIAAIAITALIACFPAHRALRLCGCGFIRCLKSKDDGYEILFNQGSNVDLVCISGDRHVNPKRSILNEQLEYRHDRRNLKPLELKQAHVGIDVEDEDCRSGCAESKRYPNRNHEALGTARMSCGSSTDAKSESTESVCSADYEINFPGPTYNVFANIKNVADLGDGEQIESCSRMDPGEFVNDVRENRLIPFSGKHRFRPDGDSASHASSWPAIHLCHESLLGPSECRRYSWSALSEQFPVTADRNARRSCDMESPETSSRKMFEIEQRREDPEGGSDKRPGTGPGASELQSINAEKTHSQTFVKTEPGSPRVFSKMFTHEGKTVDNSSTGKPLEDDFSKASFVRACVGFPYRKEDTSFVRHWNKDLSHEALTEVFPPTDRPLEDNLSTVSFMTACDALGDVTAPVFETLGARGASDNLARKPKYAKSSAKRSSTPESASLNLNQMQLERQRFRQQREIMNELKMNRDG